METGRNDPCHCGSGKKYKKCCLQSDVAATPRPTLDFAYESHLVTRRKTTEKMGRLIGELLTEDAAQKVFEEYQDSPFLELMDSAALQRHPEAGPALEGQFQASILHTFRIKGQLPAQYFLAEQANRFSSAELQYLRDFADARLTYFQVLEVFPEEGFTKVEDVFDGAPFTVYDKGLSLALSPFDIASGRLVPLREKSAHVVEPLAGSIIQPRQKEMLLDLIGQAVYDAVRAQSPRRKRFPSPDEIHLVLKEKPMIFYWMDRRIWHDSINAPLPTLTTTDGEELLFVTARFACKDSAAMRSAMLKQRNFRHVTEEDVDVFTWVNAKDYVLGTIHLDSKNGQARLETNSRERFKKWDKKLLTLGDVDLLERIDAPVDVAAMVNQGKKGGAPKLGAPAHPSIPPEDIWKSPEEMDSFFAEMWLKEKIPALGNRTPMEATKSALGRKQLKDLMRYIENMDAKRPKGSLGGFDVDKMKARLGIV
ncbi:MAG: SEC-C metal-binding domain-containing protein [Fibrobacteria bacterium]